MYVHNPDVLSAPAFADRFDAGRRLGKELATRGITADIVLGLTRGGVPVAAGVAEALNARLDIIVVKKIGAPFSSELGIGAVCADGSRILHTDFIAQMGISDSYVEAEALKKHVEARAAESKYRHGEPAPDLKDKTVVIVDDGLATGSTMQAAILSVRNLGAAYVVVAVPVAARDSAARVKKEADEIVALLTPPEFYSVGQFYADFSQVSDATVEKLMADAITA